MKKIFERPKSMYPVSTHYCPGCGHGIVHRLIAETIDELGILERTVGVAPVGCSVLLYNYLNCDMYEAAHGRAPAIATGCKRVHPELVVFTYQGDGDLASIGTAEIIHTAARGEKITSIFIIAAGTATTPLAARSLSSRLRLLQKRYFRSSRHEPMAHP